MQGSFGQFIKLANETLIVLRVTRAESPETICIRPKFVCITVRNIN
jgi:hypothetical protein